MKNLIIFDLDGTLAESKNQISDEMMGLLSKLLEKYAVAIISGGAFPQFEKQILSNLLLEDEQLKRLFLFPTCATSFYQWDKDWYKVYAENLTEEEKKRVFKAFETCFQQVGFQIPKQLLYGDILEDRGSQITFSALGQLAPLHLKKRWDPYHVKRLDMIEILRDFLPEFEIRTGGTTSIDITHKDIDKAYGIRQIEKYLKFSRDEMLFIGDALFKGGNDYPVKQMGVECRETEGPEYTKNIIQQLLS